MQDMQINRLDHLGIIAGTIKELGLIEKIDACLQTNKKDMEIITPGEAIAGIIINGLRFTSKPLFLSQFPLIIVQYITKLFISQYE